MKTILLCLSVLALNVTPNLAQAQRGGDFDRGGRPERDGRDYDRRDRDGRDDRDFGRGRRPRGAVCFARNAVGGRFRGYGFDDRDAMRDALDSCREGSPFGGVSCRPAGCR